MYVLKFNSPILPFAKFPLTHNKYIQEFLRMYDTDKTKITQVIGVHFEKNSNTKAKEAVGIEIKVNKKNNMTYITSSTINRFKIKEYDSVSNFVQCEVYEDSNNNSKDLLMSDLYELKQLWYTYNKKINQLL